MEVELQSEVNWKDRCGSEVLWGKDYLKSANSNVYTWVIASLSWAMRKIKNRRAEMGS